MHHAKEKKKHSHCMIKSSDFVILQVDKVSGRKARTCITVSVCRKHKNFPNINFVYQRRFFGWILFVM